jgi:hypothetical protein
MVSDKADWRPTDRKEVKKEGKVEIEFLSVIRVNITIRINNDGGREGMLSNIRWNGTYCTVSDTHTL